jgi:hypothetical protein
LSAPNNVSCNTLLCHCRRISDAWLTVRGVIIPTSLTCSQFAQCRLDKNQLHTQLAKHGSVQHEEHPLFLIIAAPVQIQVILRVSIDTSLTFQVLGSNHTTSNLYYFGLDKHTCVGFVLFYLLIYLLLKYY